MMFQTPRQLYQPALEVLLAEWTPPPKIAPLLGITRNLPLSMLEQLMEAALGVGGSVCVLLLACLGLDLPARIFAPKVTRLYGSTSSHPFLRQLQRIVPPGVFLPKYEGFERPAGYLPVFTAMHASTKLSRELLGPKVAVIPPITPVYYHCCQSCLHL